MTTRDSSGEYGIYFEKKQMLRSGFGVEREAGWHICHSATDTYINGKLNPYATEEEAIAHLEEDAAQHRARREAAKAAAVAKAAPAKTAAQASDRTVKHSPLYGTGYVLNSLPGATYYDDGKTQIWDNA